MKIAYFTALLLVAIHLYGQEPVPWATNTNRPPVVSKPVQVEKGARCTVIEIRDDITITRKYDYLGNLTSETTRPTEPKKEERAEQETETSVSFIKEGATSTLRSQLARGEVSWEAKNPTNNLNCAAFWLRTDVFEAYCEGVFKAAYRKHGMEYPESK